MNQKAVIICIVIFIAIVAGMFGFAYLKKMEISQQPVIENKKPEGQVQYAEITRITAKHYFIDGVHTFAGEIPLPTACDLLETRSRVMESYPEQVVLDFNVINNAKNCEQTITNQRFKVSAQASGNAVFSAEFMGRHVELNLIPAAAGEKPEDFELFIKG